MPPQAKKFNAIDGFPILDKRKNLFILTGAGISAESGLRTFRDGDGLWENHRIEDVATPEAFLRDPVLVQRFYNARRAQLREVEPNAAHKALAELEQLWEGEFTLVTQNVDDLHERGGSKNPIHMHGELRKARCLRSEQVFPWEDDISDAIACTCCGTNASLRPHIVWFGEMPLFMEAIYNALRRCDIFIAIGTSGQVYPAAGFSMEARRGGAWTIECNLVSSESPVFETVLEDKATLTLPHLVKLNR